MKVTSITVKAAGKVNLGDYQQLELSVEMTAELGDNESAEESVIELQREARIMLADELRDIAKQQRTTQVPRTVKAYLDFLAPLPPQPVNDGDDNPLDTYFPRNTGKRVGGSHSGVMVEEPTIHDIEEL